jgi:murein DD-endopeptidase MepM/ murein hydrolase activator NlpD
MKSNPADNDRVPFLSCRISRISFKKIFLLSAYSEYRTVYMVKIHSEVAELNLHIQKNGGNKSSSKGFYIALGVCLIAVGVAAWTTYDSVVNYATPEDDESQSETLQSTEPANNIVSGVYGKPESSSKPASSSQVASSSAASSSSAVSSSKPESKANQKAKSEAPVSNKPATTNASSYSYPVGKTVLRKFSTDPIYCKTTLDWRAHTGVDLSAAQGDPVKAIANGTVTKVYKDDKLGNTVIISHGKVEAWYCGLDKMTVKTGDTVESGQEIGTIGIVPNEQEEESHLHFATKINGEYVDPLTILK